MSVFSSQSRALYATHAIDNLFTLDVKQTKHATHIHMRLFTDMVNTSEIPETILLLKQNLPSILLAKCFNDDNIPFAIEVQHTEIGHLFEHILLEHLCKLKIENGSQRASFSGRTYWNWKQNPRGTFQITIQAGYTEEDIFTLALDQTIHLVKKILYSKLVFTSSIPEQTNLTSLMLYSPNVEN